MRLTLYSGLVQGGEKNVEASAWPAGQPDLDIMPGEEGQIATAIQLAMEQTNRDEKVGSDSLTLSLSPSLSLPLSISLYVLSFGGTLHPGVQCSNTFTR